MARLATGRKLAWLVLLVLLACWGSGCGTASDPWGPKTGKKRIVASIVPLHCFTALIAGDDADVRCLLTTKGPHDFQPSAHDARLVAGADLFITNGLGLEEFLESLIRSAGNRRLKVVKTGDRIPPALLKQADGTPHYHGDKLVSHKGTDPHVWLGIPQAIYQVEAIRDALCELDPPHADGYRQRASALIERLKKVQEENRGFPNLGGGLVTFHNSFQYFGESFGIPIAGAIRGLRGELIGEAELIQQAREFRMKEVKLIGVEPQYPKQVAENLARSIGGQVQVIELDPIETGPQATDREFYVDPEWYFQRLQRNLDNIRQAAAKMTAEAPR
jgi:ABC-type Zn uptake system ZnuABC Zn-binding protein ZnuA